MYIIIDIINKYNNLIKDDNKLIDIKRLSLCYIDIKEISKKLIKIEELELYNCRFIKEIPNNFINLRKLTIKFNNKIKIIPKELINLEYLDIEYCNNINYDEIRKNYPFVYILNENNILNTYTFNYIHCVLNNNYKFIILIPNNIYNIFYNYKNKFITNDILNNIKNQINQIDNNINLDNDDIIYYILLINHNDIFDRHIKLLLDLIETNNILLDDNLENNIINILNNEIFNNNFLKYINDNKTLKLYKNIKDLKIYHSCIITNTLNFIYYLI